MSSEGTKDALFEAIAVMGNAFASPVRLELLDLLAQAPHSVEELARASGQSTANASQHLQALHAAGMVTLAESFVDSYKTELIADRVWRTNAQLKLATV